MEITVRKRIYKGHLTYRPICETAKILSRIANTDNFSISMLERAKEMGVRVTELPMEQESRK